MSYENKKGFSGLTFFALVILGIIVLVSLCKRADKIADESDKQTNQNKWTNYKVKNCKITEKLIGVVIQTDNGNSVKSNYNVYECNNGMKYTIEESVDKKGINKKYIPNI